MAEASANLATGQIVWVEVMMNALGFDFQSDLANRGTIMWRNSGTFTSGDWSLSEPNRCLGGADAKAID